MRRPSESYQARLVNHHAFLYERRTYPTYVPIEPQNALASFPAIWGWLAAAIGETGREDVPLLRVEDALVLMWPEAGDGPATWCYSRPDQVHAEAIVAARTSNAPAFLLQWAGATNSLGSSPTATGEHLVVVFYLLREIIGKKRDDLQKVDDFLDTVLFAGRRGWPLWLVSTSGMLLGSQGRHTGSMEEFIRYLSEQHADGRYYQRLAVGFSCRHENGATFLTSSARDVVVSLITHWGYEIEERKAEAGGAEDQARAWAHEIGNCISFLNRDNLTN